MRRKVTMAKMAEATAEGIVLNDDDGSPGPKVCLSLYGYHDGIMRYARVFDDRRSSNDAQSTMPCKPLPPLEEEGKEDCE